MKSNINIFKNSEKIAEYLIEQWFKIGRQSQRDTGTFITALSGGNTPRTFYQNLALGKSYSHFWNNTHIFQVDERFTPFDSPDNNFKMIKKDLFENISIPHSNLHRINTENCSVSDAAVKYEKELLYCMELNERANLNFDLIILGLGFDGHTASLFPESAALNEEEHYITFVDDAKGLLDRITMTFKLINRANNIIFIVEGEEKSGIIKKIIDDDLKYPGNLLIPENCSCSFLLDEGAASQLSVNK